MGQQSFNTYKIPMKGLYTSAVADLIDISNTPWCQNVRFRFGQVVKCPGRSVVQQTLPKTIGDFALQTDAAGNQTVFALCTTTGTDNDARPYSPSTRTFGTALALQNSSDNRRFSWTQGEERLLIVRASPITAIASTSPTTFTVENVSSPAGVFIEYFKDRVFLMNILGNANRVQWSALGQYNDWATTQTHGGFLDLYAGIVEPITGGKILGDRLVVYRASSITDMVATGDDTEPFLPEGRVYGIGCMSPFTLQSIGQMHFFLGNDFNVYVWDGSNLNAIGTPIHAYIRQLYDPSAMPNWLIAPFAATFIGYKEYWLVLANQGSTSQYTVLIYDYLRDSWTRDTFDNLHALFERNLPGAAGTAGYNQGAFPASCPVLMAGHGPDYFMIDERVDGDRLGRPADGGIEMWFDSPDLYFDKNEMINGTIQRVMVTQGQAVQPVDPPYYVELSLDRGQTFPYSVQVNPKQPDLGFQFEDLNATGNVHRVRFHYKASDAVAGNPSWRAWTEIFIPSGEFFPGGGTWILRSAERDLELPPTGVEQRQAGVPVAADEPVSSDLRRRDSTDVRSVPRRYDGPDESIL